MNVLFIPLQNGESLILIYLQLQYLSCTQPVLKEVNAVIAVL